MLMASMAQQQKLLAAKHEFAYPLDLYGRGKKVTPPCIPLTFTLELCDV